MILYAVNFVFHGFQIFNDKNGNCKIRSGARVLPCFMTWTNDHFQRNTLRNHILKFEFAGRPSGTHRRAH